MAGLGSCRLAPPGEQNLGTAGAETYCKLENHDRSNASADALGGR